VWQRRAAQRRQRSGGRPEYYSVVDLGTTMLRVLVAEVRDGTSTVWGWSERAGGAAAISDVESLTKVCSSVLGAAEEMAQDLSESWILPDQILVGVPGSQLRGRAWSVTQHRSRPDRPVEERELEALLGRALRLTVNQLRDNGPDDGTWMVMDAVPVALTVDGHRVTDPVGFRASELGATVFAALVRSEVVKAWGVVARELEFSALTLSAAPVALAAGLSHHEEMLVDVGGTTTDLTWCRAGFPRMLASVPMGGQVFTQSLARTWNLGSEKAERLKQAYSNGKLDEEAGAQVEDVLSPALEAWLGETEEAMARLNRDERLPGSLCLVGGGSALSGMAKAMQSLAWSQRLKFTRHPHVRRLQPTDVQGVVNRTELGRGPGDLPALALAAWAARQQQLEERSLRILSELCYETVLV
jgi:cell division ATPase FtsA